ncbi:MAG: bacteriohemerythrin [Thermodesulfovibrionales bacterium]
MKWTEDLSTGIEKIDEQHRELFEKINDLVAAVRQSVCKYKISDVIRFLEDYVVFHFGEEENYMLQFGYPGYQSHKAQHQKFIENFNELKKELPKLEGGKKPGSYDLSVWTNQVVVDWILDHIARTDKQLGEFLKGKA